LLGSSSFGSIMVCLGLLLLLCCFLGLAAALLLLLLLLALLLAACCLIVIRVRDCSCILREVCITLCVSKNTKLCCAGHFDQNSCNQRSSGWVEGKQGKSASPCMSKNARVCGHGDGN
jgi:hypothetical protein